MVAKTESLLLLTMSMFFIFMKIFGKLISRKKLSTKLSYDIFSFFREEENNDDKKGDDLKRFEYSGPDENGMMVLEKEFHSQVKVTQCEYKLVKDQVCTLNRVQFNIFLHFSTDFGCRTRKLNFVYIPSFR